MRPDSDSRPTIAAHSHSFPPLGSWCRWQIDMLQQKLEAHEGIAEAWSVANQQAANRYTRPTTGLDLARAVTELNAADARLGEVHLPDDPAVVPALKYHMGHGCVLMTTAPLCSFRALPLLPPPLLALLGRPLAARCCCSHGLPPNAK